MGLAPTDPAAASIHFLTGPQTSINDLATATGFHYVRVPGPDGVMNQFAHSSVIMIATPNGRMSKYLNGIDYQPRDVRLALIEASNDHIGTATDAILLYCCNYTPSEGRYTVSVFASWASQEWDRYSRSARCSSCSAENPPRKALPSIEGHGFSRSIELDSRPDRSSMSDLV